jgi:glycerophosphoryl diester phosphodiesterase
VRVTRDGVAVLLHDPHLVRTTGRPWPVRTVRASTLATLALRDGDGEPPPTLDAALAAVSASGALRAALDVKVAGAAAPALAAVRRYGLEERVLLWARQERIVRHLAAAAPSVETAVLRDTKPGCATRRLLDDAPAWGARAVSVHEGVLDARLLDEAHRRGLQVYSWLRSPESLARGVALGLDGIVTDRVADAVALLAT